MVYVIFGRNYKNSTMLHLFSPHYSMGLNITNEMNICTFFHGVSAFREFHSFIVLMCMCVHWVEHNCCCHCICIMATMLSMCASARATFFSNRTHFFPWICYICCSDCIYIIRDFSRDSGNWISCAFNTQRFSPFIRTMYCNNYFKFHFKMNFNFKSLWIIHFISTKNQICYKIG